MDKENLAFRLGILKEAGVINERIYDKLSLLIKYLDEKWKKEYEKVYDLITSKLSASEKSKLESEEKEWFKKEEEKIKKELIDDGLEEGDRDYEMLFASNRAGLVKERTIELARKYDKLNK